LASTDVSLGIHQIVLRTLSGFCYLCQKLAYLVLRKIFLIARKIVESLRSYQEYPAKSVGKQGEEFPIAALVKVSRILYQDFRKIGEFRPRMARSERVRRGNVCSRSIPMLQLFK
jgi:hypothetical protein